MRRIWALYDDLGWSAAVVVPAAVLVAALAAALALRLAPGLARAALAAVATVATAVVLLLTMRPAGPVGQRLRPVLDPFETLTRVTAPGPDRHQARVEALGNVLLLLPLGAVLALLLGWRAALVATASLSVAVEAAQWLMATGRHADAADVVLNAAGGAAGVALAWWAWTLVRPAAPPGGPPGRQPGTAAPGVVPPGAAPS